MSVFRCDCCDQFIDSDWDGCEVNPQTGEGMVCTECAFKLDAEMELEAERAERIERLRRWMMQCGVDHGQAERIAWDVDETMYPQAHEVNHATS